MNSPQINKPILQALAGTQPDRCPVWFLRQAGRYLPEYREIRAKRSFLEVCHDPKLAAEVTLQPLQRFDLDAAIIFSDILILPTAMGFDLRFDTGHGPLLSPAIRTEYDIAKIKPAHMPALTHVGEAIQRTREKLSPTQAMIGFAGAPFTVASYLIEGQGSKVYTEVKTLAFRHPKAFKELLNKLAEATVSYLCMQVEAGAEAVMLFDSWAGNLNSEDYRQLAFPSVRLIADRLAEKQIPLIYFPGAGGSLHSQLAGLKTNAIAVDWRVSLSNAAEQLKKIGLTPTLQGNLDPQTVLGDDAFLKRKVECILEEAKKLSQPHIFNVGHGLLPHTPPDSLEQIVNIIRNHQVG